MGVGYAKTHFASLSACLLYITRQYYRLVEYTESYKVVVTNKAPWCCLEVNIKYNRHDYPVYSSPLSATDMSSQHLDVPPTFSPLLSIKLPSPEEYRKRKVALISGQWYCGFKIRSPTSLRLAITFNRLKIYTAHRYHWPGWVLLVCHDCTALLARIVTDHR